MKIHQKATLELFDTLRPGRILDAGSGSGVFREGLTARGFDVVALDLFAEPAERRGFVRADLNACLPFRDGVFDYVLCSESLQYLENHARVIREFSRVLKPGGSMVLALPNLLNAPSRFYFLRRGYFPNFKPVRRMAKDVEWDLLVYNPISFVEIAGLAESFGLDVADVESSRDKPGGMAVYLALKALYSAGLLFEKNRKKAELVRRLSSRPVLLGDHLIVRLVKAAGR